LTSTVAIEPEGNPMTSILYFGVGHDADAVPAVFAAAILKDFDERGRPARVWHDSWTKLGAIQAQWSTDARRARELSEPLDNPGITMMTVAELTACANGDVRRNVFRTQPYGEHVVTLLEDRVKVGNRIYEVRDTRHGRIGLTGEEMESLCRWWTSEVKRVGVDQELP
jgi:hypothetical protein